MLLAPSAVLAQSADFNPALVVNRVDRIDDQRLGKEICTACSDYFGNKMECIGHIATDRLLARSVLERKPAALLYPQSPFVRSLRQVIRLLIDSEEEKSDG